MPPHRIYFEGDLRPGPLTIGGDEAHHAARVKRLEQGDAVTLLNGRGQSAAASISLIRKARDGWELDLDVREARDEPPPKPRIEVCSAAPKGPRLADMIDGLSQAGAAAWRYLETDHSAVEPRPAKLDRLVRTAAESSKQCGRAWLLEIGEPLTFDQATASQPGMDIVIADASGGPYARSGARAVRILIGPEGGWSARERQSTPHARACRFGPHTMRVETAAVLAAGIILDAESHP